MSESPMFIQNLTKPTVSKQSSRKVWGISLNTVWLPTLTATNLQGNTTLPSESLGYPVRLSYNKDGSVRLNSKGKPVFRVDSEISKAVTTMRENMVSSLLQFVHDVKTANPEGYQQVVDNAKVAAASLIAKDDEAVRKVTSPNIIATETANQATETANQATETANQATEIANQATEIANQADETSAITEAIELTQGKSGKRPKREAVLTTT